MKLQFISKTILAGTTLAIIMSGAALADELVRLGPVGQGGIVSFIKPAARTTSVALFWNRHGVGKSTSADQKHGKLVSHTVGPFGNSSSVSYYAEESL